MSDTHLERNELRKRIEKLEEEKRLRAQSKQFHEAEAKQAAVQWSTWN